MLVALVAGSHEEADAGKKGRWPRQGRTFCCLRVGHGQTPGSWGSSVEALEMKRLGKGLFAQKKASPQPDKRGSAVCIGMRHAHICAGCPVRILPTSLPTFLGFKLRQLQKLIGRSDVSYTDASKLVWRYIKQRAAGLVPSCVVVCSGIRLQ